MAKTKYDKETFPLLGQKYAREGLNDEQIAEKLGIGTSAYYEYQNKYVEFSESIKNGKRPVDIEVENTLLKNALGYEFEEKSSTMKVDSEGNAKVTEIKTVTKHIKAEPSCMFFWLVNRMPEDWKHIQKIEHSGKVSSLVELVKEYQEKEKTKKTQG